MEKETKETNKKPVEETKDEKSKDEKSKDEKPTATAETKEKAAPAKSAEQSKPASKFDDRQEYRRRPTRWAIIKVFSSKNDTILTATDVSGQETLATSSGGKMVKSDREEGKPYAAMQATIDLVNKLKDKGVTSVHILIRAPGGHGSRIPGGGAQAVVRTTARLGVQIGKIMDVTPIPTDTTRRPGGRRGRRV